MPNPEVPDTAPVPVGAAKSECLTLLAAGLSAYLQEIDDYRAVCRRHDGTAVVDKHERGLRVTRYFAGDTSTVAHLRAATLLLPHRERRASPEHADEKSRENLNCLVRSDTLWDGRRLLVRAFERSSPAILHVELILGSRDKMPELPLRAVATALRCHEFLLPASLALPLPVPHDARRDGQDLLAYLTRTMPPNLHASQCI